MIFAAARRSRRPWKASTPSCAKNARPPPTAAPTTAAVASALTLVSSAGPRTTTRVSLVIQGKSGRYAPACAVAPPLPIQVDVLTPSTPPLRSGVGYALTGLRASTRGRYRGYRKYVRTTSLWLSVTPASCLVAVRPVDGSKSSPTAPAVPASRPHAPGVTSRLPQRHDPTEPSDTSGQSW